MSNGDALTVDELTARIDRLERDLAKLLSERDTVLTNWPNAPTIAQGFLGGRWQRRDGSLQTGDARYLSLTQGGIVQGPVQLYSTPITANDAVTKGYVDQSLAQIRAPTLVYNLPADVTIAGDGAWHELALVPFVLTRTGISRIQVTLNCNTTGVNNVASIGARLAAGGAERTIFGFGVTPGGESVGFTCNLYFDTSPGAINIPIELTSLVLTGAPAAFTILGGSGPRHSQIVIVDLGPAPEGKEHAESKNRG